MLHVINTLLLFLLVTVAWAKSFKRKEIKRLGVYIMIVFLIVYSLKLSFREERPSLESVLFQIDKYSFPSTHAALGSALGLYIGTPWAVVLSAVIAILRYVVEAHYLRDVIAGWIIGAFVYVLFFFRDEKVIFRKILHMCFASVLVVSHYFFYELFLYVSLGLGASYMLLISLPLGKKILNTVKSRDRDVLSPLYMCVGSAFSYLLFPSHISFMSLIFLAYGDALSTLVGKAFPYFSLSNSRHLTGTMAGCAFSFTVSSLFVPQHISLLGGVAFILYEAIFPSSKKINDNALLPLFIGSLTYFILWVIKYV